MKSKTLKKKLLVLSLVGITGLSMLSGCAHKAGKNAPEVETNILDIAEIDSSKYVVLGDYKNLEVNVLKKSQITDADVESYMEYVASTYSQQKDKPAGSVAALGDTVNIDFEGKKDGVVFEGGTAKGYDLVLGSGSFIDGFETGVAGMKIGETKDLDLTFPATYHVEDLAGAPVVFTVKLNAIKETVTPELNDEFAKSLNIEGVTNFQQYKDYTKKMLEDDADKMYEQRLEDAILTSLLENSSIKEIPSWLVDHYRDSRYTQQENYAQMAGMSIEDYAANYYGMSIDDFSDNLREAAKRDANIILLIKAVADAEGVSTNDVEVDELINKDLERGDFESIQDLYDFTGYYRVDYEASKLKQKVYDVLKNNAIITEVDSINN